MAQRLWILIRNRLYLAIVMGYCGIIIYSYHRKHTHSHTRTHPIAYTCSKAISLFAERFIYFTLSCVCLWPKKWVAHFRLPHMHDDTDCSCYRYQLSWCTIHTMFEFLSNKVFNKFHVNLWMNAFPDIARYFYISNLIRVRVARGRTLTLFIYNGNFCCT